MAENKNIQPFECNMYSMGFNHGRKAATKDIIEAIDDFLKYDYPDIYDDFVQGMKKAREIVKDWGLTMAENKMEAVAQLFGKELDEQFYINSHERKRIARFTVFGLSVLDEVANPCEWNLQYALLNDLLTGKVVIVDEGRR